MIFLILSNTSPNSFIGTGEAKLIDPLSLQDHEPIKIDGNSQFISSNGVISGDGSSSNPFIIENWSIDINEQTGIYIYNTNSYFIIKNCYFFDSNEDSYEQDSIMLSNVENVLAELLAELL